MTEQVSLTIQQNAWLHGWRRTALLLTLLLVSAFCQIDRILPFILAESIKTDLHLSDTQLGLINGIAFALCYSLASLPLARLADKGWPAQVLMCCIFVWSFMTGLGGLATSFIMLALSRLGVALGEAGGTPASHALIANKIPESLRGRAIGLFSMGIPLGTMLGFGLGGRASDTIGWRNALFIAAGISLFLVLLILLFSGKNNAQKKSTSDTENFILSARALLSKRVFLWTFIAANVIGFAAPPFYIFTAPFLMRTHGLTASEVGLSFGLLQGLMGIAGTLSGGRLFDKAVKKGKGILIPPAALLGIGACTNLLALFMPSSGLAIALLVPGMLSFSFLLPYAFGTGHLIAGQGKQALSSSILMIGSGLLGPALSPLFVGLISDTATAAHSDNGLRWGMLVVPFASTLGCITLFIVNRYLNIYLNQQYTVINK